MYSDYNNRKRRFFLEYVDLQKTDPLLKADGQISFKRGKGASQKEIQMHMKLEKELSPRRLDMALLRPESQPAFTSTSLYRQDTIQKPVYANPPSLPPSSPPAISSEGDNAVVLFEEGDVEADPFGFLATEKKLKDKRPRFPSTTSYLEVLSEEDRYFGEKDISRKDFASLSPLTLKKHLVSIASVEQKRIMPPLSPSASLFTNCSNDPSSPCRKAVGRRSTTRRKAMRRGDKRKNNESSESKFTALDEAFPPKHPKTNVQENGRTKRNVNKTSGKRAPRRHSTKSRNTGTEALSHLNDEERRVSFAHPIASSVASD